jgi:hypothetical protein
MFVGDKKARTNSNYVDPLGIFKVDLDFEQKWFVLKDPELMQKEKQND